MDSLVSDVVNVNKMMSIGNKEDIDEADCIDYFNTDNTEVIGMYLESIHNGTRFMEAARRSSKPVLVYKVGRTEAGAQAAMSHTAGMANNDVIFDAACRQAGVIRCNDISELHSMPKIFTTMPLLKGNRIAIFTNSGAFGGITSDLLVEAVREKGARGVIYASLKFCDAYLYDFPRVQERLLKESIPVLRLESDYADGNTGQVLTRVEAFLEMLV